MITESYEIWTTKEMPKQGNLWVVCLIPKKWDPLNCNNYKGITLAYKVLSNILRLLPYNKKLLEKYQCGFQSSKSTRDQIFILRQTLNLPIKTTWGKQYEVLYRLETSRRIDLIIMTMKNVRGCMKIQNDTSESRSTKRTSVEGCAGVPRV